MEVSSTTSLLHRQQYQSLIENDKNNVTFNIAPPECRDYSQHLVVDIGEDSKSSPGFSSEKNRSYTRCEIILEAPIPSTEEILMAMSEASCMKSESGRGNEISRFYTVNNPPSYETSDPKSDSTCSSNIIEDNNHEIVVDIHHDSNQQLLLQELQEKQPGMHLKLDEMEAIDEFDADGPFVTADVYSKNEASGGNSLSEKGTICENELTLMEISNWPETWCSLNTSDIENLCSLDELFNSWSESLPDMVLPSVDLCSSSGQVPSLISSLTNIDVSGSHEMDKVIPPIETEDDVASQDDELKGIEAAVAQFQKDSSTPNVIFSKEDKKVWVRSCHVCGTKLRGGRQRYDAHMQNCHQWSCLCGMEYLFKQTLTKHIETEAKSSAPNDFILHGIRKTQPVRPVYECDLCDEIFRTSTVASKHRRTVHNINDEDAAGPIQECRYCKEVLKSQRELKRHEKICPLSSREVRVGVPGAPKPKKSTAKRQSSSGVRIRRPKRQDIGIKTTELNVNEAQTSSAVVPLVTPGVETIDDMQLPMSLEATLGSTNSEVTSSSGSLSLNTPSQNEIPHILKPGGENCPLQVHMLCQSTTDSNTGSGCNLESESSQSSCTIIPQMIPISQGFQVLRRASDFSGPKPLVCTLCRRDYFCKKSLRSHIKNVHNITTEYLSYIYVQNPELIRLLPTKTSNFKTKADGEIQTKRIPSAKKRKKTSMDETVTSSSDLSIQTGSRNIKCFKMSTDCTIKKNVGRQKKSSPPGILKSILISTNSSTKNEKLKHCFANNKPVTVNVINNPILTQLCQSGPIQPQINSGRYIYILSPVTTKPPPDSESIELPKFNEIRKVKAPLSGHDQIPLTSLQGISSGTENRDSLYSVRASSLTTSEAADKANDGPLIKLTPSMTATSGNSFNIEIEKGSLLRRRSSVTGNQSNCKAQSIPFISGNTTDKDAGSVQLIKSVLKNTNIDKKDDQCSKAVSNTHMQSKTSSVIYLSIAQQR